MLICSVCRRHVKRAETRCPFCTAAAAVGAIAAGVALQACTPERGANVYGGPPPQPTPVLIDAGGAAPDAAPQPPRGGDVYGGPPPK